MSSKCKYSVNACKNILLNLYAVIYWKYLDQRQSLYFKLLCNETLININHVLLTNESVFRMSKQALAKLYSAYISKPAFYCWIISILLVLKVAPSQM
jgi:hypothetical protein